MLITSVQYTLDYAEIVVEIIKSSVADETARQDSAIDKIQSGGLLTIPESYT